MLQRLREQVGEQGERVDEAKVEAAQERRAAVGGKEMEVEQWVEREVGPPF